MGCFSAKCHSDKSNKAKGSESSKNQMTISNDKISAKLAAAKNTLNYNFDKMKLESLNVLNKLATKNSIKEKNKAEKSDLNNNSDEIMVKVFSANNNFLRNIPKEFFKKVTKITKIDFSFNEFQEIDEIISEKTTLKILLLNNNFLNSISKGFLNLKNLKELNLSHNLLNESEVNEKLIGLENLENLNLSHNKIKTFPIKIIKNEKLFELNLSNNLIESAISNEFWDNSNLQYLELSFNKLTISELADNIFNCSIVANLNLKGNKILLEELKHTKGFEKFVERRRQKKEQGFLHNLAINFDFCGLD
jgi:Leucine-rich repeat (LRR) protein